MAFFDDLLARVRGAFRAQDWPPPALKEHWVEVEYYRLRYRNDAGLLVPYNEAYSAASHERKQQFTPVPLAREMARFSSSLLFSEPAKIMLERDQKSVDELMAANGAEAFWHDAAESVATEGRGGLRIIRDNNIDPANPLITYVNEDQIIWDIRHGRFIRGGIVVITAYNEGGNDVYRMLEAHEPGQITRKVYRGQENVLGTPVPNINADYLPAQVRGFEEVEKTPMDQPTLVAWDNVPGARSDLYGIEILLDRIDEAESLLVEKARKSRPWIFSARSLADENGNVDISNLLFLSQSEAAQYLEGEGQRGAPVVHVQPDMQTTEHVAYIEHLRESALTMAGYSLASWGVGEGGTADSGTALRLRQGRTLNNRQGKERMAREAMSTAIATAMAWKHNQRDIALFKPEISFGDGMPEDNYQDAQRLQLLKSTSLISLEQAVRIQWPDWDDKAVLEEVARIRADVAASAPVPPTTGRGGRVGALLASRNGQQQEEEPEGDQDAIEEPNGARR